MTIHLEGDGVNSHWNVHRSLETLQGLESSSMQLIQQMDEYISKRNSGGGQHQNMIGNAVAATVLTSHAAEVALKTLHAQMKPDKRPPHGHDLLDLFDELDPKIKDEAQSLLLTLPPLGAQNWIGASPHIRALIKQGKSNFTDWRYGVSEQSSVSDGIPKVLVNVVHVVRKLILQYVAVVAQQEDG